jgi:hypothetical protein
MRLGGYVPWNGARSGARALFWTDDLSDLPVVRRLTFSNLGGLMGALMAAFGMGTRWIILFCLKCAINWLGQRNGVAWFRQVNRRYALGGNQPNLGLGRRPNWISLCFRQWHVSPGVMNHGPTAR